MRENQEQKNHSPVPSIERAFLILDFLAQSSSPHNLKDIHEHLELPKTSTLSILRSLVACNVVRKNPDGKYQPGIRLYTLGTGARMMLENGRTLLPRLKALRDETGHTVFFSLYENGEQVVWEKVDGPGLVLFKAFRGERKRLNISSAGKAIAAFLPPQELKLALQKGLQQATPNSIVSEEDFIRHLAEIRSQGYAIDDEEGEPGVYCIGVPVFTKDRMIYGAVSMSTLKSSLLQKGINQYISAVRSAAEDIGNTL